jgi:hypothetical protein
MSPVLKMPVAAWRIGSETPVWPRGRPDAGHRDRLGGCGPAAATEGRRVGRNQVKRLLRARLVGARRPDWARVPSQGVKSVSVLLRLSPCR